MRLKLSPNGNIYIRDGRLLFGPEGECCCNDDGGCLDYELVISTLTNDDRGISINGGDHSFDGTTLTWDWAVDMPGFPAESGTFIATLDLSELPSTITQAQFDSGTPSEVSVTYDLGSNPPAGPQQLAPVSLYTSPSPRD